MTLSLTVERSHALAAVSRAVGVIERKQTIPILGNVAITADGSRLTIRSTNLEMEVIESVEAQVHTAGEITVPADKLHDIIRNADAGSQIAILMEEKDPRVKVKSGRSRFSLPALPAVGFPKFSAEGLDEGFDIPAVQLANLIDRVYWSIDPSDKNTVKGCVRLATHEEELHAVGACGNGVALRRMPRPAGATIAATLPAKVAAHIVRWLSEAEGDAHISTSESRIQVTHGDAVFTASLFDAPTYFNYVGNIHEDHEHFARVAQDELSTALRRVMVMADGKVRTLRLTFTEGMLTVKARSDSSGDGQEEIGADYEGPEATVMIDGPQLTALMGALVGDIVEFGFSEAVINGTYKTGLTIIRAPVDTGLVTNIMQMKA